MSDPYAALDTLVEQWEATAAECARQADSTADLGRTTELDAAATVNRARARDLRESLTRLRTATVVEYGFRYGTAEVHGGYPDRSSAVYAAAYLAPEPAEFLVRHTTSTDWSPC